MKVYQILGRRAQLVSSPNGDDKNIPPRAFFQANPSNLSVQRLLRMRPPACRELIGEEIPEQFRDASPKEDIVVIID
jgi:hypothetical protein